MMLSPEGGERMGGPRFATAILPTAMRAAYLIPAANPACENRVGSPPSPLPSRQQPSRSAGSWMARDRGAGRDRVPRMLAGRTSEHRRHTRRDERSSV